MKFSELFLIVFVWLVLLITPAVFAEEDQKPLIESIMLQLKILIPLSLLLIANRFFLIPEFLFRRRPVAFFVSAVGLICLLTLGSYFFDSGRNPPPPRSEARPAPLPEPFSEPGRGSKAKPGPEPGDQPTRRGPIPAYVNFLVLSILLLGFDTGLSITLKWAKSEQEKAELEKENVAAQLVLLRNQVNPHFFMNTLNNIHSLVDIHAGEAKSAIIGLSKLMRYLLYDTANQYSTLAKEIEFIELYIQLTKLRLSDSFSVQLHLPASLPESPIPSFLFFPLIDNAFKHSISYKEGSFVKMELLVGSDLLLFMVQHSLNKAIELSEYAVPELEDCRKRLTLLYGDNYQMDMIKKEHKIILNLSIPS